MPIIFKEKEREFHLYNDKISYILYVLPNGHLGQLYFGKRVSTTQSYTYLRDDIYRPLTNYVSEESDFSLTHAQLEYPSYGTGDMRQGAFEIRQSDGSCLSDFCFSSFKIIKGKPDLAALPHTYIEKEDEATTLIITMIDRASQTLLDLTYTIYEDRPVVTRSSRFYQEGAKPVRLTKALSLCLDFPDADFHWVHLDGAWGRERFVYSEPLHQGVQSIYSLKGASSSEHNPFLALKRTDADEHQGEVYGFSLVYSGNFLAQVEVSTYRESRLTMGIHPECFEWVLEQGESFQTPEVVMVYSEKGLNGMSQAYHALYRERLVRGVWRDKGRPILLNDWEAVSFDFDEKKVLSLAEKAASLGMELFVMDDGWFGKRNHDRAGLGDWKVNTDKLKHGLSPIIEKIHTMGMLFGLWIEPEMVNKDSDLYRKHPDWIFHHKERTNSHGRHQYVLDLTREDVYQNIYQQLHELLSTHEIDYIKWDMNRYATEVYSYYHDSEHQGELFHRYILNVYRLYEELTSEFPQILFESCSSGGGRFDPGMLYYAPQTWTSDNTDAIERLKIQYGTSLVYPLSSMGCHVSEVPNQQLGRVTPLDTRAQVAYFGNFGYELDLEKLSEEEEEAVRQQVLFYKQHRQLFQEGIFTRLLSPFEGCQTAWQVRSESGDEVMVGLYALFAEANRGTCRLRLQDLDENALYQLEDQIYSASSLMSIGIPIKDWVDWEDFQSRIFYLKKLRN